MEVRFSKEFGRAVKRLSGKRLESVKDAIQEVMDASSLADISNCKKLKGYRFVYRIRVGNYRAFFVFHVHIENDTVKFEYLLPRGEAYNKKNEENLRLRDN